MITEPKTPQEQGRDMDPQLENVLKAYAAAEPGPSRVTLAVWIREFPNFARELTDFTARWMFLELAGDAQDAGTQRATSEDDEEERLILCGMSAAQSVFYSKRAPQETAVEMREAGVASPETSQHASPPAVRSEPRIDSLIAAAGRIGLTYVALKDLVGISDALLQKLNRRLVDPLTVPVRVLADIAAALHQRVETVAEYVALPSTFAAGAQHRANQALTLPRAREDFFEAVQNDAALSDVRKRELLALPRPGAGGALGETPSF